MSFVDMYSELSSIPKVSRIYARTIINRALQKIYDESSWSFQLGESGWITPPIINQGTATTTIGSPTVTGDAVASAAWTGLSNPVLTMRQFRCPAYALYNIIAANFTVPTAVVLTLDRPWMEPPNGAGQTYMMYQAYYPAPVADFDRWLTIRDFTNAANLNYWSYTQRDLALSDPQRTIFQNPNTVVPYLRDTRGAGTINASVTLGYMLYELYPHQLAQLPYALAFFRSGPTLVAPGDTVPAPLTDELVLWRAREILYQWKEEQKGIDTKRGSGADYKFLAQGAKAEYDARLKDIRKKDRDTFDAFMSRINRGPVVRGAPFYSPITGSASIGSF